METVLEIENNNTNHNTVMKREDVEPLKTIYYVLMYSLSFIILLITTILSIFFGKKKSISDIFDGNSEDINIDTTEIILKKLAIFVFISILLYLNGKVLVQKLNVKINYTRKINHIAIWLLPFIIDLIFKVDEVFISNLWNIVIGAVGFLVFTIPIRTRDKSKIIETMFDSFDRPEDRPNTLLWLSTQNIFTALTLAPFIALWSSWSVSSFIFVPLIVITFGDGLAEPIGVYFGKHKYKASALCTTKEYERSFEGSLCVYLSTVCILSILYHEFTNVEFFINLSIVPFCVTITEAFAPHTWDNPLLIFVSSGLISLIHINYI
jgi:dolichol kinase